jgi:diacylglycerol kinase family enzyme
VREEAARPAALVLLNRHARGGGAATAWESVRRSVEERFRVTVDGCGSCEDNLAAVGRAATEGARVFLAAGGDGTVNALLNALLAADGTRPLGEVVLGAIGLGSSNDFHKPGGATLGEWPCRIDAARARPRDVGLATITEPGGRTFRRAFLVSASLGVTAEANAFFNGKDPIVRALKRRWTAGAIAYAALRTISRFRNLEGAVTIDGTPERVPITNLSVLKTPFLSGGLRFDTPVLPDDGLFAVNLCAGMGRWGAVRALADLARGRFAGRPNCRHWRSPRVAVAMDRDAWLELDGEVTVASRVRFAIGPERIPVCA